MKILHVTKKYPQALGGDSIVVANLEMQQRRLGHDVSVLTSDCSEIIAAPHIYTFGLHEASAASLDAITPKRIFSLIHLFFRAYGLLKSQQIDVVHSHSPDMGFVVAFAARLRHVPVIHTCHGITFTDVRFSKLKRLLERFLLRSARYDHTVVLGEEQVAALTAAGIDSAVFIPNGVDRSFWRSGNTAKDIPFTFLAVGRLEDQKRFDLLLESAARLARQGEKFVITIAGEGSQRVALEQRAFDLAISDKVNFVGAKSQEEIRGLHERSSAFVLSSAWEGFPLTLLEAWAMRQPAIATDVGSIKALAGGGSIIVSPGDSAALAGAMGELLHNAVLRRQLSRRAEMLAARYDWTNITKEILRLYTTARDKKL